MSFIMPKMSQAGDDSMFMAERSVEGGGGGVRSVVEGLTAHVLAYYNCSRRSFY